MSRKSYYSYSISFAKHANSILGSNLANIFTNQTLLLKIEIYSTIYVVYFYDMPISQKALSHALLMAISYKECNC
jgi:hypothetical protein